MEEAAYQELERLLREETKADYEVEREIGRGGMAVVYLAREIHLERRVAIKVLPPNLTFGKGAARRFVQEAQLAAGLDHPNIIPIYRISNPAAGARLVWYAMKYLEGESLADVLQRKNRLSLDETLPILRQVAEALDYAHKHHVIHRDVKPANVMIMAGGRVIVTDFGIAKQYQSGSLTASGSIVGTPYYMSGEQARGKLLTQAADQYSVGVMAYHMLAGQVPFEADSVVDILRKHCSEPAPPLEVLRPSLPREIYIAIDRAMAKEPLDRFPSVTAFVQAMQVPTEATTMVMQAISGGVRAPWAQGASWLGGVVRRIGQRWRTRAPLPQELAGAKAALSRSGEQVFQWAKARPAWSAAIGTGVLGLATWLAIMVLRTPPLVATPIVVGPPRRAVPETTQVPPPVVVHPARGGDTADGTPPPRPPRPVIAPVPDTRLGILFVQVQDTAGNPIAAQVFIGGQQRCHAFSCRVDSLTAGEYHISAIRTGWLPGESVATVSAGDTTRLVVTMRKE
jgi:tRNA A-37 threonylcarbamoyl transferase component Bud32